MENPEKGYSESEKQKNQQQPEHDVGKQLLEWRRRTRLRISCSHLRQRPDLDLAKVQLQRITGDFEKAVGRIGQRDVQFAVVEWRRPE